DGDLNRTDLADPPPADTSRTGGLNDFPFALTTVTSADGGKAAEHGILHRMDLPAAVADRTGLDGRPRFGPIAMASRANFRPGDLERGRFAEGRIVKLEPQIVTQLRALLRSGSWPPATAAKEHIENVAKTLKSEVTETTRPGTGPKTRVGSGVAEPVVRRPFLRITQYLVGFIDLFKFLFRLRIIFIDIGMVFSGQSPVRFFNLVLAGPTFHPQHLIIISFRHG